MRASPDLYWLPEKPADWRQRVSALGSSRDSHQALRWAEAVALAKFRLDFSLVNALDRATLDLHREPPQTATPEQRLALLSSSTSAHLCGALRVAALRHDTALEVYEPSYGQYRQDLADPHSHLHAFAPTFLLFAFDASSVAAHAGSAKTAAEATRAADDYIAHLRDLWLDARARTGAAIIQQTIMPRWPDFGGSNDHRFPGSRSSFTAHVNMRLRELADEVGVDLVALDRRIVQDGLDRWFSTAAWYNAKQEVSLPAAPMYGDLVARVIAARLGRSAKCCIFDLDNTLWGGVIGDDGLQGIVIGEGSAAGEGFLSVQHYALELRQRGILLAVCSKNDEANAVAPFDRHPDMVLERQDISCFVANWQDKPSNIRSIARRLNIGLDSLVFVDDNPFERDLVRSAVPEIFVPDLPEDPALVPRCLADAGCFEMVALTSEDVQRAELYAANAKRDDFKDSSTNLQAYLAGLDMVLQWGRFDELNLVRLIQLINKTNQFNLTTRRLSELQVRDAMTDPRAALLQFRLVDRFGDNGIIAVVMGHLAEKKTFAITDWLMSCRVLGRQVEEATLNVVASVARGLGASDLRGTYRPTGRNQMVADLLERLGFTIHKPADDEVTGVLSLDHFVDRRTAIQAQDVSI